jgi:hypothetical protein
MGPDAWGTGIFAEKSNLPPPPKSTAGRADADQLL